MPERLTGLEVPLSAPDQAAALRAAAATRLGCPVGAVLAVEPTKRSLDARKRRDEAAWVFAAIVFRKGEEAALAEHQAAATLASTAAHPAFVRSRRATPSQLRPLVVGTGPAGLFAALTFAEAGVPCTVLERGKTLSERHVDVRTFRRRGELDGDSNLCFGEGGSGTYSDGKLYTRKHHPLVRTVYERLVAFGATPDILVDAHPHIGTNKLYAILDGIRHQLLERDVDVRFSAKMQDLWVVDGQLRGVILDSGEQVPGFPVVLATGHSARDVYAMLARRGVALEQKPFAIGARAEHPQELVDRVQLGAARLAPGVGAAEYFLACKVGERGVYSFCMCPGGYVIPTPTEPGHLNVNGMSNSNRGGKFANAALVVTVEPRDYFRERPGDLDDHGVLSGIAYQRAWERLAYEAGGGGYLAPAQRLTDLVAGRPSTTLPERTSFRPGIVAGDMADVLPASVVEALRAGVRDIDRRLLRGYLTEEAIIIGVETTTSSPVRVSRDAGRESPSHPGLYPTGEGAGFSGGIVSSCIEGVESAWAALERYCGVQAGALLRAQSTG
jgi:hypothetical protein